MAVAHTVCSNCLLKNKCHVQISHLWQRTSLVSWNYAHMMAPTLQNSIAPFWGKISDSEEMRQFYVQQGNIWPTVLQARCGQLTIILGLSITYTGAWHEYEARKQSQSTWCGRKTQYWPHIQIETAYCASDNQEWLLDERKCNRHGSGSANMRSHAVMDDLLIVLVS